LRHRRLAVVLPPRKTIARFARRQLAWIHDAALQRDFFIEKIAFGLTCARDNLDSRCFFSIERSTTWIWRGAQLLNQGFELRGPLGQGGSYPRVASRLGELEQRLHLTLEIVSADHDGRPHNYRSRYIMQEPEIYSNRNVQR
jgi:hypothetical protein